MDNRGDELPTPIDEVTVKKSPTPSAVSFELESVKTPLLKEQKAEGSSDESNKPGRILVQLTFGGPV